MRVVLDTNVLVSALLKPMGRPADVVMAAVQGRLIPLFDGRILDEYREVLLRPKFGFDVGAVASFVADLEAVGEHVDVGDPPPTAPTPDPDDRPFLEVAIAGRADALVTGNRRHFPDGLGVRVLLPAELVAELRVRGV